VFVCISWKGGQGAPFCRTCRPSVGYSTQLDICVDVCNTFFLASEGFGLCHLEEF
jgi:hypothetical protein